jgi:predicted nuclease of predicted toxin-antitoxin system
MNLAPSWIDVFGHEGWKAFHWSAIGKATAADIEILDWAAENDCVIFTHDLDFGALLASRPRRKPSVIQLRNQETSPAVMGATVVSALKQLHSELEQGALVTIDPSRARARVLPLE